MRAAVNAITQTIQRLYFSHGKATLSLAIVIPAGSLKNMCSLLKWPSFFKVELEIENHLSLNMSCKKMTRGKKWEGK